MSFRKDPPRFGGFLQATSSGSFLVVTQKAEDHLKLEQKKLLTYAYTLGFAEGSVMIRGKRIRPF